MKVRTRWIGAALLVGTAPLQAETFPVVWCDGCGEVDKQAMVTDVGSGRVYIGDLKAKTFSAYDVYKQWDISHEPPRRYLSAVAAPTEAPYKQTGEAMIAFYYAEPVGWGKTISADYPDATRTVYDVVNRGKGRNDFTAWLDATKNFWKGPFGPAALFKSTEMVRMPWVHVTVRFADHGSIDAEFDYLKPDPRLNVLMNSALDSHRNSVISSLDAGLPLTEFDFGGEGNPRDVAAWRQQMTLLGAKLPSSPALKWWCRGDAPGKAVCDKR